MNAIDLDFREFHAANPHVYELFVQFAKQVRATGRSKYSADAVMHRIRWHLNVETRSFDGFKINNNFASRYARLLIAEQPDFEGFFELRKIKSRSLWT